MFDRLRNLLLRLLRVPAEPEPPFGDPQSTRVFRAGKNYLKLRLIGWGVGQIFVLGGIIFGIGLVALIEYKAEQIHAAERSARLRTESRENNAPTAAPQVSESRQPGRKNQSAIAAAARFAAKLPPAVFALLWVLKAAGLVFFAGQALLTYVALRLDYEMRWYIVTDRSLRIRTGLWRVQEMTMSFANLQQVEVSQGPLQRLLGIADVRVKSAGGGGDQASQHGAVDTMHPGFFHGVDNGTEVRDVILKRLRSFRETGLGDPDEIHTTPPLLAPGTVIDAPRLDPGTLAAAQEVLAEVRQLRASARLA
jgi:membrane protein YdbS with pleckstrin-like domain